MLPIGPLMVEHRRIEQVAEVMKRLSNGHSADPQLVDVIVDFMRTYGDRTHHGKEEDILFAGLVEKDLLAKDREVMDALLRDHVLARGLVTQLNEANGQSRKDGAASRQVIEVLSQLAELYLAHIRLEDKVFFPACLRYLSAGESELMLQRMVAFDRRVIHDKYAAVASTLQAAA